MLGTSFHGEKAEIELVYFAIHGRGLLTRMLLKMGNVAFKDTKPSMEEFAIMKPSMFAITVKHSLHITDRMDVFKTSGV